MKSETQNSKTKEVEKEEEEVVGLRQIEIELSNVIAMHVSCDVTTENNYIYLLVCVEEVNWISASKMKRKSLMTW